MKSQIICLHSHEVSGVRKSTETGSRKDCRGCGKEELGEGNGEEKEQERGKEKRNKEEKMRNGLDEELGPFRMGGGWTVPRVA